MVRKYCENESKERKSETENPLNKEAYTIAGMQQSEKIKEQILNSRLLAESVL